MSNQNFYVGDTHGNFHPILDFLEKFSKSGDTLISVGDFGIGFIESPQLHFLNDELKHFGVKLLVVRGNHDNPYLFKKDYDYSEHPYENIELVKDYSTRVINGKKHLFVGGAISIDRVWRIANDEKDKSCKSYWVDEVIDYDLNLLDGVEDIDVIVTHSAPEFLNTASKNFENIQWAIDKDPELKNDLIKERIYLSELYHKVKEKSKVEKYYFGHFHISKYFRIFDTEFKCLGINEVVMS